MKPRTQTTRAKPYHSCAARSSASRWGVLFALAPCAVVSAARAHESPAKPPLFAPDECIRVVDTSDQSALEIAYSVEIDDIELTFGDIAVEDAKTHQFFAFRGALHPIGFNYELYPFDVESDDRVFPAELPLWITLADVKRASDAADPTMAAFDANEVPLGAVLAANEDLGGRWFRITPDDARVPITAEQAKSGVRFDLSDVEPGLYTIAGYIFSPPYNAWAVRPGIVKVVSADVDPPVVVLDRIHAFAFAYQGRRVPACVDVPDGTRIRGRYRVQERPEAGAIEWLPQRVIESGQAEFCFHNPRPELTGSVRLWLELETPDGSVTRVVSPDTLTALSGQGVCTPSADICCDFEGAVTEALAGAGGAPLGGASGGGAGEAPPAAGAGAPLADEGSGCSATAARRDGGPWLVWLGVLLLAARARRR